MPSQLNVDEIRPNTSGKQVEFPQRPYMFALHNDNHTYTAGETIDQWRVHESRGITESSGVFTVPADGLYQISFSGISGSSGIGISFYHNSTDIFRIAYYDNSPNWTQSGSSFAMVLEANDTVKMEADGGLNLYGTTSASAVGCFSMIHLG